LETNKHLHIFNTSALGNLAVNRETYTKREREREKALSPVNWCNLTPASILPTAQEFGRAQSGGEKRCIHRHA